MDVFALRESLIGEYAGFARSFTDIRAEDLRAPIEAACDDSRFWPEPLVQVNRRFMPGRRVSDLVAAGELHPTCGALFDRGLISFTGEGQPPLSPLLSAAALGLRGGVPPLQRLAVGHLRYLRYHREHVFRND